MKYLQRKKAAVFSTILFGIRNWSAIDLSCKPLCCQGANQNSRPKKTHQCTGSTKCRHSLLPLSHTKMYFQTLGTPLEHHQSYRFDSTSNGDGFVSKWRQETMSWAELFHTNFKAQLNRGLETAANVQRWCRKKSQQQTKHVNTVQTLHISLKTEVSGIQVSQIDWISRQHCSTLLHTLGPCRQHTFLTKPIPTPTPRDAWNRGSVGKDTHSSYARPGALCISWCFMFHDESSQLHLHASSLHWLLSTCGQLAGNPAGHFLFGECRNALNFWVPCSKTSGPPWSVFTSSRR